MNHTKWIVQSYGWLLRLYPQGFRAEYADEMREVFASAVAEADDNLALAGLCASEIRDLPLRVLQEHLQARRRRVLVTNTGVMMTDIGWPAHLFKGINISLFLICGLFMVTIALPFFALGLHTQTSMEVISGPLGPEAFVLYRNGIFNPNPLPKLAIWILLGAPIWGVVFGIGNFFLLVWLWRHLSSQRRLMGMAALLAGAAPLLFLLLPVGGNTALWWFN